MTELPDDKDRLLAVTTFDKNVVVTAGAGTGKTTLLIDRITHLLMRGTAPLKITDIIAITFTRKAANEMKIRLRNRLQYFMDCAERMGGDVIFTDETPMSQGYHRTMEIPLNPPFSKGETIFLPPLEKGGKGGFERVVSSEKNKYEAELLRDIMHRYNLGMDVIAQRAVDAINNIEKAQIGTIHSFAGHILRLYALEAGIC